MKIVTIMPILGREKITKATLKILRMHPIDEIIVVGSGDEATATGKKTTYLDIANNPLGRKVQYGVKYARELDPDYIMLCGSDSWLSVNWIPTALQNCKHFYGQYSIWLLTIDDPMKMYKVSYLTRSDPMGVGRIYSKKLMEIIDWKLFPENIDRGLDGASWNHINKYPEARELIATDICRDCEPLGFEIKSSKWPTITHPNTILAAKNLSIAEHIFCSDIFNKHFNYIGINLLKELQ
jgi:hypothetical protein